MARMIAALWLDPRSHVLSYRETDGYPEVRCYPGGEVVRRYEWAVPVMYDPRYFDDDTCRVLQTLPGLDPLRLKIDVRMAVYAVSEEAAAAAMRHAEHAIMDGVITSRPTLRWLNRRERRRLARCGCKRRIGCRRVPKVLRGSEPVLDIAYLVDLCERKFSSRLATRFPMAVPPAR